jgi:6-phosphofructokinase 1
MLEPRKSIALDYNAISGLLYRGGTILGTANRGKFSAKTGHGDARGLPKELLDETKRAFQELGLRALVSVGGDGSLSIAQQLFEHGISIVGVPKTIDNDLSATQVTFGFDTALHTVSDALDKIHTTAASHHRVMVVEVMGRDCGWIALEAGLAGGAHVILIPEIPFTIEHVCRHIAEREKIGKHFTIVVVAEGVKLPPELKENRRASSIGNLIGNALAHGSGKDVRVSVLGHIQRGGSPSPFDRILATRFGVAAVDLVAAGGFGMMVALHGDSIVSVDVAHAIGLLKSVNPNGELVRTARAIGIGFGD